MDPKVIAAFIAAGASCLTLLVQVLLTIRMKKMEGRMFKRNKGFEEELKAVNEFYDAFEELSSFALHQMSDDRPTELPEYESAYRTFKKCVRDQNMIVQMDTVIGDLRELKLMAGKHHDKLARVNDPLFNQKYVAFVFLQMRFREKLKEYRDWLIGYGPRPKKLKPMNTEDVKAILKD